MRALQWTAVVLLFVAAGAYAADWPVVYQTDFSTDPGWIDDDVQYQQHFPDDPPLVPPEDHFWQEEHQNYFIRSRNWIGDPPAPYDHPNRFSYTPVPWTGESFELTWDYKPIETQWSAAVLFGMWDEQMYMGGVPQNQNCIFANFCRADQGTVINLGVFAGGNSYGVSTEGGAYQDETTYGVTLLYDSIGQTASLDVIEKLTGNPVASLDVSILAPFTAPLNRLGASMSGMGEQGYPGVDPDGIAQGLIDNVRLEMVPEPCVLTLAALGALGLVLRRRAR